MQGAAQEGEKGGHTHLRGGKSKSVRVSRQGEIRDMTHHAGAAHWRANTLEARIKMAAYKAAVLHVLTANAAKVFMRV